MFAKLRAPVSDPEFSISVFWSQRLSSNSHETGSIFGPVDRRVKGEEGCPPCTVR